MIFFGYSAKGRFTPDLSIQIVDKRRHGDALGFLEGPFPSMIHDFAVTQNWIVLPIFPLTCSMERACRPAALCLGAGQRHAYRLHPAQGHGGRREVGDGDPPPTSSIR